MAYSFLNVRGKTVTVAPKRAAWFLCLLTRATIHGNDCLKRNHTILQLEH